MTLLPLADLPAELVWERPRAHSQVGTSAGQQGLWKVNGSMEGYIREGTLHTKSPRRGEQHGGEMCE